jgi:hypothetical protein
MVRRTVGMLLGVLIWGVSTTAMAQTTTSSSSTTSSTSTSTTSTSTTSTSTTSTTRVNPCATQPCTADPPVATLSGSGGNVRLESSGFCWREMVGDLTRCVVSARALDEPVRLVVRTGETLTLSFATTLLPREVVFHRENQPDGGTVLAPTNPTTLVANLPVGVYYVSFQTKWTQGDVGYSLKIDVRAQPRPLALTG